MPSPGPPGWKFNPSDEELLNFYLKLKTLGHDTQPIVIGEVGFCQNEPSDLPDLCILKSNSVWHFFCPLEFKYQGRGMRNRQTRAGFWKPTGKPKPVNAKGTNEAIGRRRTLAFYQGTFKKNVKTKWQAYEYELIPDPISTVKGHFVLCKVELRDKKETSKRQPRTLQKTCKGRVSERVPSSSPSNVEGESSNSITNNTAQMMNESPCVESEVTNPATFVSENQLTSELSANSACIEIIPGQVLDSGYENLHLEHTVVSSFRGDAEPTHQMDFDCGNQNSDSMTNYHTCDYDSPMSLLDFEGESSALSPYVFETRSWSPMMEIHSDPSNVSSECYNGETCGLMNSDCGNQSEDNDVLGVLDFGNENQDNDALGFLDFGNQNQDDKYYMSAFNEGECNSLMGRPLSSCDRGEARSIITASDLGNHSNIDISSDFGDKNNGKNSDILAFEEGQCSSFRASILDFEDKNPCKMTELLTPEESSWSYLIDCSLEDDKVEDFSRKIVPPPVAELESLFAEAELLWRKPNPICISIRCHLMKEIAPEIKRLVTEESKENVCPLLMCQDVMVSSIKSFLLLRF